MRVFRSALGPAHLTGFVMEQQKWDMWCWAAVAVSVARYFKVQNPLSQCKVASLEKAPRDCCSNPGPCNDSAPVVSACGHAGFKAIHVDGAADVNGIHQELSNDLPLGWRCEWSTEKKASHVAVISAIQPGAVTHVDVDDPWFSWSNVALRDLVNGHYLPHGALAPGGWKGTYFMSRPTFSPLRLLARRLRPAANRLPAGGRR